MNDKKEWVYWGAVLSLLSASLWVQKSFMGPVNNHTKKFQVPKNYTDKKLVKNIQNACKLKRPFICTLTKSYIISVILTLVISQIFLKKLGKIKGKWFLQVCLISCVCIFASFEFFSHHSDKFDKYFIYENSKRLFKKKYPLEEPKINKAKALTF